MGIEITKNRMWTWRSVALVCALLVASVLVGVPGATPRAQAQTGLQTSTSLGDCSLRQGAPRNILANELCWLDLSPLADPDNVGKRVTQKIGPNTLSYKIEYSSHNMTRTALSGPVPLNTYGPVTFGNTYFRKTDEKKTILSQTGNTALSYGLQVGRLKLTDLSLTNAQGQKVPDVRFTIADAENTNSINEGEWIGINSSSGVAYSERLDTPGYNEACGTNYGRGNEPKPVTGSVWKPAYTYQFICHSEEGVLASTQRGSFFATTGNDPTYLEVNVGTVRNSTQAFALALSVGRITVPSAGNEVSADTAFEEKIANTKTAFDYKVFRKTGGDLEELTLPNGQTTPVIRSTEPNGDPNDSYIFTSAVKPNTGDPNLAIKRYKPVWRCSLYDNNRVERGFEISEGAVPSGFGLTWNESLKRSELTVRAAANERVQCAVKWQSRFKPASLQLGKNVDGSASQFKDAALRTFDLNYTCKDNIGFGEAYGEDALTGTRNLQRGTTAIVDGLAAGLECDISESFPKSPSNPDGLPVAPGKRLDLNWQSNDHPSDPGQYRGGDTHYQTTLKEGTNTASAFNRYTYLSGQLTISKEILGEPVSDAKQGTDFYEPEYQFRVVCESANKEYPTQTISMTRTGTAVGGSVVVNDIPLERDCTVRPLTDLDETQRQEFNFDGRVVTVDGGPAIEPIDGAYPFRLTESKRSAEMHFRTSYSYQVRNVDVEKRLAGVGAGVPELANASFEVSYRCTTPAGGERSGSISVAAGKTHTVEKVPVYSECKFWESSTPNLNSVALDDTTVEGSGRDGVARAVSNEDAEANPVMVVQPTDASGRNVVTITNTYSNKLGVVQVNMSPATGPSGVNLPSNYKVRFVCGTRSVMLNGAVRPVALNGTVTVSDGSSATLVADTGDRALNALVNDQNGSLGVPYGNTCTFSPVAPDDIPAGVLWRSVGGEQKLKVDSESQSVTFGNEFENAGQGVTIYQTRLGAQELFPNQAISYQLTCTLNGQKVYDDSIRPGDASAPVVLPNLIQGTDCELTEQNPDNGERRSGGDTFPISRNEAVSVVSDGAPFNTGNSTKGSKPEPVSVDFTVGTTTTVAIEMAYDYVYKPIHVSKNVAFDPATAKYISDDRKNDKQDRAYWATLVCTNPAGNTVVNLRDRLTSRASNGEERQYLDVSEVPVGSKCSLSEEATDVSRGVKLTRQIEVNAGGASAASEPNAPVEFTVGNQEVDAVVTNTFERILTSVNVDKVAVLPGSVREQYENAGEDLQEDLKLHRFTMVCKDPKTNDEATLATFDDPGYTIKGESARSGTLTFNDVPVGADCQIEGNNFDSLHLTMTEEGTGDPLEAYLIPRQVDWVVDRAGGNTTPAGVEGGVSKSPVFLTTEPSNGTTTNHIVLRNQYVYETSKVSLTKDMKGLREDLMELDQFAGSQSGNEFLQFNFTMQCKAIGQQLSTLGSGDTRIPRTISKGDFPSRVSGDAEDGEVYYRYDSPEAEVPAGSLCTFAEVGQPAAPDSLTIKPVEPKLTVNAPEPGVQEAANAHFVNEVKRRTAPVRFSVHNTGYLTGIASQGYTGTFKCVYSGTNTPVPGSETTARVSFSEAAHQPLSLGNSAPFDGTTVTLPVGVDCSVSLGGPAMDARKEVAVVDGDRRPYAQFASWTNNVAAEGNPKSTLESQGASSINKPAPGEQPSYGDFTVPASQSAGTGAAEFVVAAEVHHPRATADVKLTKRLIGKSDEKTFNFASSCSDTKSFKLGPDDSVVLKNIPVNSECSITEELNPDGGSWPSFEIASKGSSIAEGDDPAIDTVAFEVLPVDVASDTSTSGDNWAVELRNTTATLDVTKRIDGTPLSRLTGIFDTALLAGEASTMTVNYEVQNSGGVAAKDLKFVDESLAGMTVRAANSAESPVTIGEDGAIPVEVCAAVGSTLEPGESVSCSLVVELPAASKESYSYSGEVTVSAATEKNGTILDADSYRAYRPSALLAWALPSTGMQTLVLLLLLGLLLFGYGAYRMLRRDDEEFAEGSGDNGTK